MSKSSIPSISTHALTRRYGAHTALNQVTLSVEPGSVYALVGPNGAGKTTLIQLLMNLQAPTSGSAEVLGRASGEIRGRALNRIGYVSESQEMPNEMTVGALLDFLRPFYPAWDRKLEGQLLSDFALPLDRKLKHLSRGMRMKAAFVNSLSYRPELLVLDEPFSGLDPLVRDELIEGLLERAPETTIFLSSHDLAEIESFASHVGYLEDGRMLFSDDMAVLNDRFRDVSITLAAPTPLPPDLPPAWLLPETVDCVLRFVHSEYKGNATDRELAAIFASARDISAEPMPLRSIFLAIAKSSRSHNRAPHIPAADRRSEA
jgi:ABC-2 type transport system ATP-binding protein